MRLSNPKVGEGLVFVPGARQFLESRYLDFVRGRLEQASAGGGGSIGSEVRQWLAASTMLSIVELCSHVASAGQATHVSSDATASAVFRKKPSVQAEHELAPTPPAVRAMHGVHAC